MVFKLNTANIQYFFLDIQIKYSWKSINSLLKYCTLHKTCSTTVLTTIYFFYYCYQKYFSHLLTVKDVNLILGLKLYVALTDLRILKILSVVWMKKFWNRQLKVCEIYWGKTKFDHFKWSKIRNFCLSTMTVNTQPSSK